MAHITEFTIAGLADGEGTYTQKLNRDVNIFFGLNGSGKTSLLKILHAALNSDASILHNVSFNTAEVKLYSNRYKKEFSYFIKQEPSEGRTKISQSAFSDPTEPVGGDSPKTQITWTIKPELPADFDGRWHHSYLPTSRLYSGTGLQLALRSTVLRSSRPPAELSEEQLDFLFSYSLQQIWSRYSSETLKRVRKAQEDGLASIFKTVLSPKEQGETNQLVDPKIAYDHVTSFLKRQGSPNIIGSFTEFEERYSSDPSFQHVVSDIDDVEKRIEEALDTRMKLQSLLQSLFSGKKRIILQDDAVEVEIRQNKKISLERLSSGEKHLLTILIHTLLAHNDSILIDEPEISMHIDWQRQLVDILYQLNPSVQIIVATHSPEIMADVPDERIFSL